MMILAIETSCDDTCAAVLENDRLLGSVISSQIDLHRKWGGVVPDIAKRAHQERIDVVIAEAMKKSKLSKGKELEKIIEEGIKKIDIIAVTYGPGLAIALGVGVNKAKELAKKYHKKLVAVNHIEGHLMSNLIKNKQGKPERKIIFPALNLTASGGHSKLILINNWGDYKIIGETLDDAAGEALDKAAKLLGLGYPGGPVIERIALKGNPEFLKLPRPLADKKILDFSFSGLKTSFYYQIRDWDEKMIEKNLENLAASFQEAVFDTLIRKWKIAIEKYQPKTLLASGGIMANQLLRIKLKKIAREKKLPLYLPVKKVFNTDNAAMIGVAGYVKALRNEMVIDIDKLDREARAKL